MSEIRPKQFDFRLGLWTPGLSQAAGAAVFSTFYDGRVTNGACQRRLGKYRVAHVTPTDGPYCADFNGSSGFLQGYQPCTFGPEFTVEALWNADTLSATHTIIGGGGATSGLVLTHTSASGGTVTVALRDTSGNTATASVTGIAATTLVAAMVVRSGADVALYVNNGTPSTTTIASATNSLDVQGGATPATVWRIGANNGANFFDGKIDFVRGFKHAKSSQKDGYTRLVNPWARTVQFDYCMENDAVADTQDRSPFGNHMQTSGGVTFGSIATLAVNPVPIQAICANYSRNNVRQVVILAGGRQYVATVT